MDANKIVSEITFAMSEQSFKDTAVVAVFGLMLILLFCYLSLAVLAGAVKTKCSLNSLYILPLSIMDDPIWDNSPYYAIVLIVFVVILFVLLLYLPRRLKEKKRKEVERK